MKKILSMFMALATVVVAFAAQPKYIFYFIGDGMGMGPVTAAEMYNRQVLGNETPITMMQFPVAGFVFTYSANRPVTDSAAAGTALSTGFKTKNGMLGMNPDTLEVYSIARALEKDGYGIGIATSVAPDDATPGAFYAHVPHRSMYYEIGVQAAHCGYPFLAGAGLRGLEDNEGRATDLLKVLAENNVDVVYGKDAFEKSTSERVLLLNGQDNPNDIPYTIDSVADQLTLPYITEACLKHLQKVSPDKFFMMIEGGNIDHALHANDGGAAIKEILNFNQALGIAYEFYKQHPEETLIVVTADHDTGGMTLGNPFLNNRANLKYIDYQKVSKEQFSRYCRNLLKTRRAYTWDDMREYLHDNFGFWGPVEVNEAQTEALKQKFDATFEMRNSDDQKTLYSNFNAFAVEVFKVFNDVTGLGFTTTNHSGNPVPIFAVGCDAQRFSGLKDNTDIPKIILEIAQNGRN